MTTQHDFDKSVTDAKPKREYEQSGMYPENDKPFRIFALLGWLAGIVVFMLVAAAVLDLILLER
jgi:hypothetical protein